MQSQRLVVGRIILDSRRDRWQEAAASLCPRAAGSSQLHAAQGACGTRVGLLGGSLGRTRGVQASSGTVPSTLQQRENSNAKSSLRHRTGGSIRRRESRGRVASTRGAGRWRLGRQWVCWARWARRWEFEARVLGGCYVCRGWIILKCWVDATSAWWTLRYE